MSKFFRAITCALMTILCCLSMAACGNDKKTDKQTDFGLNNEFVEVMSVSYKNEYANIPYVRSQMIIEYNDYNEWLCLTEEQYEEEKKQIPQYEYSGRCINISRDKANITNFAPNAKILLYKDFYFYEKDNQWYKYAKATVKTREIRMVSVQIIDNRSFLLKTYDGDISYITTDYYRVEYFK